MNQRQINFDILEGLLRREGLTVGGYTLAATPSDRAAFASLLVLLNEAERLAPDAAAFRASLQTIRDHAGNTHSLTVSDLRALLVAYGLEFQTLWQAL
jgi:hypothetical protein